MNFNVELLISSVENRPCLWDKLCADYKDRVKTTIAWKEICYILREDFEGLSDEEKAIFGKQVLKKWNNIRDSFRKRLKHQKVQESGAPILKKYVYYDQLIFLKKVLDDGEIFPSLINTEEIVKEEIYDEPTTFSDSDATSYTRSKRRRNIDIEGEKTPNTQGETENAHLLFFRGILPNIEDFNEDETIDFQMGLLQLIKNIKKNRAGSSLSYTYQSSLEDPFLINTQKFFQTLNIDIDLLISSVENRPCLWDKSSEDYKDRMKTTKGWEEVCAVLRQDFFELPDHEKTTFGKHVLKKWNNIRDCFRKYLKQVKEKGSDAAESKRYVHYKQLLFLERVLEER